MSDTAGSIREVTIEGMSFNVAADANLSFIPTQFENSMIPTSGKAMRKMVKRIPSIEGLVFLLNGSDLDMLKNFAESSTDLVMSVTLVSGDNYQSQGTVELESFETEENRATCSLHPNDKWTPFLA